MTTFAEVIFLVSPLASGEESTPDTHRVRLRIRVRALMGRTLIAEAAGSKSVRGELKQSGVNLSP